MIEPAGLVRAEDGGRRGVAVNSLADGRYLWSPGGPAPGSRRLDQSRDWLRWMPGTMDLICAAGRTVSRIDPATGRTTELLTLPNDVSDQFALSRGGNDIYVSMAERGTTLWTAEPVR